MLENVVISQDFEIHASFVKHKYSKSFCNDIWNFKVTIYLVSQVIYNYSIWRKFSN